MLPFSLLRHVFKFQIGRDCNSLLDSFVKGPKVVRVSVFAFLKFNFGFSVV